MSWFSDLASQAIKYADNIAETIVADINKAQKEIEAEQNKIKAEENNKKQSANNVLLPWETDDESRSIISQDLMENILLLSLSDNNFVVKPRGFEASDFRFNAFIPIAMQLLALDSNLAKVHSKLMPRMHEEDFWCNYYFRIQYLRLKFQIDDRKNYEKVFTFSDEESSIIIYPPEQPDDGQTHTSIEDIISTHINSTNSSSKLSNNHDLKTTANTNNFSSTTSGGITISATDKNDLMKQEKRKQQDDELAKEVQAELGEDLNDDVIGDLDLDDLDMEGLDMEGLDIGDIDDQDLLDDILNNETDITNNEAATDNNNNDDESLVNNDSDYDKI